jgi:chemotaxis protein CheZ
MIFPPETTTMPNPQELLMRRIMSEITEKLTNDLRAVLSETIERQLSTALTESLLESEFYRRISKDMRGGLKKIYREIEASKKEQSENADQLMNKEQADKLFHEASAQLSAVLSQTEKAAEDIMEIVERRMETQERMAGILAKEAAAITGEEFAWLRDQNTKAAEDLNNVLTALSFQDLTGQRIKLAVKALHQIETTVVELYLSTGLLIQAYEENPDKDLDRLEEQTRKTVSELKAQTSVHSELKGPATDVSQKNIDDLLAQLGMD